MPHIDETKLHALLEAGQFAEATQYVREFFAALPNQSERADATIEYALMRMRLLNLINRRYLESVDGIIGGLQQVRKTRVRTLDKLKLARTRAALAT